MNMVPSPALQLFVFMTAALVLELSSSLAWPQLQLHIDIFNCLGVLQIENKIHQAHQITRIY